MDECLQLKDKIEHLIRRGYLAQFITKHSPQPQSIEVEPTTHENANNRLMAGTIHTVDGCLPSIHTLSDQSEES